MKTVIIIKDKAKEYWRCLWACEHEEFSVTNGRNPFLACSVRYVSSRNEDIPEGWGAQVIDKKFCNIRCPLHVDELQIPEDGAHPHDD
mgnify:FL=1